MRIGIDGTPLSFSSHGGVRHYSENLLFSLAHIDKKNDYVIFSPKDINIPKADNFHLVKYPTFLPFFKRQFSLGILAKREKIDVFHYLEPYGSMFFKSKKIVTTVHDLDLSKVYPLNQNLSYLIKLVYCRLTRFFVFKKTFSFISVSKFVSKELSKYLTKINYTAKINVIYEASSLENKNSIKIFQKKKTYFLGMGDFSPRKNIPNLISAYLKLPEKIKRKYQLKIVISSIKIANKFKNIIRKLHTGKRIKIVVNAKDSDLINLYRNAIAFCYVSKYEGFGIPLIEAMSLDCPVIASNTGAIKEVAGNAALLVNPNSIDNISKAMLKVCENNKLESQLIKKGTGRSKNFSWTKTAKETLKVYENTFQSKK